MCLLWYFLYLWYYLCVSIYIYISHINEMILSPYILGRKYFLPFFFHWLFLDVLSLDLDLLLIPCSVFLFFFSACFEAVCGYVSYKNWRSSCGFSQVGRNWKTTHICWDRKCALRLPTNWSFVLATCDKQTEQHPWRFGDFEAAI